MRRRSLDPAQIIFLGGWVEKLVRGGEVRLHDKHMLTRRFNQEVFKYVMRCSLKVRLRRCFF